MGRAETAGRREMENWLREMASLLFLLWLPMGVALWLIVRGGSGDR